MMLSSEDLDLVIEACADAAREWDAEEEGGRRIRELVKMMRDVRKLGTSKAFYLEGEQ